MEITLEQIRAAVNEALEEKFNAKWEDLRAEFGKQLKAKGPSDGPSFAHLASGSEAELNANLPSVPDLPLSEKGMKFARCVRAKAVAQKQHTTVERVLETWGSKDLAEAWHAMQGDDEIMRDPKIQARLKALGMDTLAGGGALVPTEYSAEIIELLRAKAVVRQSGAMIGPIDTYPKQTGAGTASYVGENSNASASSQTFGQIVMNEKHLIALTAMSNSLIRRSDPRVDVIVRDDLVAVVQLAEDLNFLRGTGSVAAPKGILNWTKSGNKFNANGTVNLANIVADCVKMIRLVDADNVPFLRPGWVVAPRSYWYLYGLLDSNGHFVFRDEMSRGLFMGFPIRRTSQIPTNLGGGGNESEVYFGDFAQVVIGEDVGMEVEAFPNGAYYDGSTVISGISQDQTVIRVSAHHDFAQKYDGAFSILQAVTWGA